MGDAGRRPPARSRPGAFARAWAKAVSGTSYLPMTQAQLEALLQRLTERLAEALRAEPFDLRIGQQVGAELVAAHIASAEGLGRTIEVIQLRLLRDLGLVGDDVEDRMARLLATVATGYARALRDRTLDEQESIRRAAMVARAQAERALRESEARFRHQATHDPLTDLPNRTLFTERLAAAIAAPGRRRRPGRASASSTWTGSRWSTTRSATRSVTRCWSSVARAAAPRASAGIWWPGSAATSSSSWSRAPPAPTTLVQGRRGGAGRDRASRRWSTGTS